MFASKTLDQHVVRGVLGFSAIGLAVLLDRSTGTTAFAASMGLGIAGLVALKGCPICWTTGLIELVWSRTREVSQ